MNESMELAQKVLDHLTENPHLHNQYLWAGQHGCQTAGCIAGWTTMLCDEYTPVFSKIFPATEINGIAYDQLDYYLDFDGNLVHELDTPSIAAEKLGLNDKDKYLLFSCSKEEVAREALRYIANGKQIDWVKLAKEYGLWEPLFVNDRYLTLNQDERRYELTESVFESEDN